MPAEQPQAKCRPCKRDMPKIWKSETGETFWCPNCGTTVEHSFMSRPEFVLDRCGDKHNPIVERGYSCEALRR